MNAVGNGQLKVVAVHDVQPYGRVEVWLLSFLMPATDGGECSGGLPYASAALPKGKRTPLVLYYNFAKGMEFFCFSSVLGTELDDSCLK